MYKLIGVCKSYREGTRDRKVLGDVNAEFQAGKFIAVRGRSGSGKSTLLNLLGGLDLPDAGEIMIKERSLNTLNEQQRTLYRRRHIGFVFQSINLIPTLSVGENLAFPLQLNGVRHEALTSRVRSMLEDFSLAERIDSFPDQLSGGEQQRVAIARAIVHTPDVVLADEPTGNLDRDTEEQILSILWRLPQDHGVTVICATHSPEIASRADTIFRIDNGRLQQA